MGLFWAGFRVKQGWWVDLEGEFSILRTLEGEQLPYSTFLHIFDLRISGRCE